MYTDLPLRCKIALHTGYNLIVQKLKYLIVFSKKSGLFQDPLLGGTHKIFG